MYLENKIKKTFMTSTCSYIIESNPTQREKSNHVRRTRRTKTHNKNLKPVLQKVTLLIVKFTFIYLKGGGFYIYYKSSTLSLSLSGD